MTNFIGIDLGISNSMVAYMNEEGVPQAIPKLSVPSVIYFGDDEPVMGQDAHKKYLSGKTDVAVWFKRQVGNRYYEQHFKGRRYTSFDLTRLFLKHLKEETENYLKKTITHAVITVPSLFNCLEREAIIQACDQVGLQLLSILDEPIAAAYACRLRPQRGSQFVLVYHLGGSTFDVSVVQFTRTRQCALKKANDFFLGGRCWDKKLANYIADRIQTDFDYTVPPEQYNQLLLKAEELKCELSTLLAVDLQFELENRRKRYTISRTLFNELTHDLLTRTQNLTEQLLKDAELAWGDLTAVLLVGGATRMPMVRDYINNQLGRPPLDIDPEKAVALGAVIQAAREMAIIEPSPRKAVLAVDASYSGC